MSHPTAIRKIGTAESSRSSKLTLLSGWPLRCVTDWRALLFDLCFSTKFERMTLDRTRSDRVISNEANENHETIPSLRFRYFNAYNSHCETRIILTLAPDATNAITLTQLFVTCRTSNIYSFAGHQTRKFLR